MKTTINTSSQISPYPILSVKGRKGQKGDPLNSSPDKGRLGGISFLPPYGGGTFCEAKGGGVGVGELRSKKAFTLVELIIVITILAILATIAFMSFQGYMKDSRDAVRVSDLTSASKGLTVFFTKSGVYPDTESGITLTASGIPIGYQGSLGQSVVRAINMNQVPLDPVDQTRYIYSTSAGKTKFQLMAYTENSNLISFLPQSYAIDYSERGLAFQGDELGVVLNNDNSLPTINVETASGTSNFKVLFDKTTKTEGSGNLLFSQIYNMRDDLINKKELASLDSSLVGYWDMETLTGNLLKDWSKYGNHGTCYYTSGTTQIQIDCGKNPGPKLVEGKGMYFDQANKSSVQFHTFHGWYTQGTSLEGTLVFKFIFEKQGSANLMRGLSYVGGLGFSNNGDSLNVTTATDQWLTVNSGFQEGNEYELVNVYNIDTLSVYINGILIKSVPRTETKQNVDMNNYCKYSNTTDCPRNFFSRFAIGNKHWNMWAPATFQGRIDNARVYNRALSDSEIKSLYNSSK